MPASIFAGSKVKTLKSTLSLNGGADIISSTTNPQTSAVSAEPGSLLLNTTSGIMYRKLDAGSTTNWVEVGAGSGGKNYIKNPDFDGGATTNWSMQKVSLSSLVPTGNIGAADAGHTIAASSSSPLEGANSLLVQGASAFTAGNCLVSEAFAIDREDQAKVMGWSFYYEAVTSNMDFSGTSAGTWAVYIAEVTTATPDTVVSWIQPAGVYNLVQSSGAGIASGTFQTTATGTAYRLVLVCINSEAAATTLKVDDFQLGPQKVLAGAAISDWVSYTPSWLSSGTQPTIGNGSLTGGYRRVGDSAYYKIKVAFGTTTSAGTGEYRFTLPAGHTIDYNKMNLSAASDDQSIPGNGSVAQPGINRWPVRIANRAGLASNEVALYYWHQNGTTTSGTPIPADNRVTATAPNSWTNTAAFSFEFGPVPIQGWSSNTVLSDSTDTRVVAASGWNNSATNITASTTPLKVTTFGSATSDSHASWSLSNQEYIIPVSGYYSIFFSLYGQLVPAGVQLSATIRRGASHIAEGVEKNSGTATEALNPTAQTISFFNAGDVVSFWCQTNISTATVGSFNPTSFSIQRLSGPATIAASESVVASAQRSTADGAQTYSTSPGQTFRCFTDYFPTDNVDTHGILTNTASETYATIPVSGVYEISRMCRYVASSTTLVIQNYILLGGTNQTNAASLDGVSLAASISNTVTASDGSTISVSYVGRLNAGDIIRFKCLKYGDTNMTMLGGGTSQISIKKVGN